jgi:hypothetical protein
MMPRFKKNMTAFYIYLHLLVKKEKQKYIAYLTF